MLIGTFQKIQIENYTFSKITKQIRDYYPESEFFLQMEQKERWET